MKLVCHDNNCEYGIVGMHTSLTDSDGKPLRVGDVVLLKSKTAVWSKLRFVAHDNLYAGKHYIMGAYFGTQNYDVRLVIPHEQLQEGFGIGNVYYVGD